MNRSIVSNAYISDIPVKKTVRIAFWGIIAVILTLLCWSFFAEINQVTRAQMQIIISSRTQLIQSVDGGVIADIHVKEGDLVRAGDLLVTLNNIRASAAVSDSKAKVAALRITLSRLEAEVYGKPLSFANDLLEYSSYIKNQTDLYAKRQRAFNDDIRALEEILRLVEEELNINRELEKTGDVSRADILRLERTRADLSAQLVGKRNKYFQDAQAEMTKAREDLSTQIEQLHDRMQVSDQTQLRASVDGTVNIIRVNSIGGVLRSGEVVMELLPNDGELLAEAKVSPVDVAFVAVGQNATIKLDAYDSSIFGSLAGLVKYISPDIIVEDSRQGSINYYRVQIQVNSESFSGKMREISLRPGLTGSVEIKARDRSVFSYLVKPIIKTLESSLSER